MVFVKGVEKADITLEVLVKAIRAVTIIIHQRETITIKEVIQQKAILLQVLVSNLLQNIVRLSIIMAA